MIHADLFAIPPDLSIICKALYFIQPFALHASSQFPSLFFSFPSYPISSPVFSVSSSVLFFFLSL